LYEQEEDKTDGLGHLEYNPFTVTQRLSSWMAEVQKEKEGGEEETHRPPCNEEKDNDEKDRHSEERSTAGNAAGSGRTTHAKAKAEVRIQQQAKCSRTWTNNEQNAKAKAESRGEDPAAEIRQTREERGANALGAGRKHGVWRNRGAGAQRAEGTSSERVRRATRGA
jgi:hypothetical protein